MTTHLREFYDDLDMIAQENGGIGHQTTLGSFVPGSIPHVAQGLEIALEEGIIDEKARFVDMGSGDGRMVAVASYFGLDAYGVEIDGDLVERSVRYLAELCLPANFGQGDFTTEEPFTRMGTTFAEMNVVFNFFNGFKEAAYRVATQAPKNTLFMFYNSWSPDRAEALEFPGLEHRKTLRVVDDVSPLAPEITGIAYDGYMHLYHPIG